MVQGLGCWLYGFGCRVLEYLETLGPGLRFQGFGLRVPVSWLRIKGS